MNHDSRFAIFRIDPSLVQLVKEEGDGVRITGVIDGTFAREIYAEWIFLGFDYFVGP